MSGGRAEVCGAASRAPCQLQRGALVSHTKQRAERQPSPEAQAALSHYCVVLVGEALRTRSNRRVRWQQAASFAGAAQGGRSVQAARASAPLGRQGGQHALAPALTCMMVSWMLAALAASSTCVWQREGQGRQASTRACLGLAAWPPAPTPAARRSLLGGPSSRGAAGAPSSPRPPPDSHAAHCTAPTSSSLAWGLAYLML